MMVSMGPIEAKGANRSIYLPTYLLFGGISSWDELKTKIGRVRGKTIVPSLNCD